MGKVPRVDEGGHVYHVYNRGNAGGQIFFEKKDYMAFEKIVEQAKERVDIRILAFCLMPNHWHFVLYPETDNQLRKFFHWLTLTHTQRWQVVRDSVGLGHVYQGKYKSNLCQDDGHFLQLVRYVERNALRANLVQKAEDWQWSSVWRRLNGTEKQKSLLSEWLVPEPKNYLQILNSAQNENELESIRTCLRRGRPYGDDEWTENIVRNFGLEASIRPQGRQVQY